MAWPDALDFVDREPQPPPLQPAPERLQSVPCPAGSFCTVAVKSCEAFTASVATAGETFTAIFAVIAIAALAEILLSVTEVAVNVTIGGCGGLSGAV